MKGSYNIRDRHLFDVLTSLTDELENHGMDYSIMSGLAAQLHLAKWHAKEGSVPINKSDSLKRILRTTGDIDIAVRPQDGQSMIHFFNEFAATHRHYNVQNSVDNRPVVGGVFLNYFDSPEMLRGLSFLYDDVLDNAVTVPIQFGANLSYFRAEPLEHLIVEKVSKNKFRPVDSYDLDFLFDMMRKSGQKVNYDGIRANLERAGRPDRYQIVERFQNAQSVESTPQGQSE